MKTQFSTATNDYQSSYSLFFNQPVYKMSEKWPTQHPTTQDGTIKLLVFSD